MLSMDAFLMRTSLFSYLGIIAFCVEAAELAAEEAAEAAERGEGRELPIGRTVCTHGVSAEIAFLRSSQSLNHITSWDVSGSILAGSPTLRFVGPF
jgi:hypothetical protein